MNPYPSPVYRGRELISVWKSCPVIEECSFPKDGEGRDRADLGKGQGCDALFSGGSSSGGGGLRLVPLVEAVLNDLGNLLRRLLALNHRVDIIGFNLHG